MNIYTFKSLGMLGQMYVGGEEVNDVNGCDFYRVADVAREREQYADAVSHYACAPPDYVKRLVLRVQEEEAKRKDAEYKLSRGMNRLLNLVAELEQRERGTTHWEGCAESHLSCKVIEAALAAVNELEPPK